MATAAAVTTFGMATAVLSRPLPFNAAERLVFVWESTESDGAARPSRVTGSRYADWTSGTASFSSLALFGAAGFTIDTPAGATAIRGVRVSGNYFETLGIRPLLGRTFTATDDTPGKDQVVLLSHALWQEQFGARREVVGQTIRLSGRPFTVIGVVPPVVFPAWPVNPATVTLDAEAARFWVPIPRTPQLAQNSRAHVFGVVGRLAPGITAAAAQDELTRTTDRTAADAHAAHVAPLREQFVRDARTPLLTLLAAALAVLLIACANLAALYVSSFESRRGELALRAAIGAGTWRLARQLTLEALLLAAAGGVAGTLLARTALATLPALLPSSVPLLATPALDLPALGFALALTLLTTVVLTAWPVSRLILSAPAPRGVAAAPRAGVYRGLVVAQVATTVALVVAAGLLAQSLRSVQQRDPGFALDRVFVAEIGLPSAAPLTASQVIAAEQRVLDAIRATPGIREVAAAYDHPLEANWSEGFNVIGDVSAPDETRPAELRIVSPSYFDTLNVEVLNGRTFTPQDDVRAAGVVMINEAFARELGGQPLGRRIRSGTSRFQFPEAPNEFTIVGVVEDERSRGLEEAAPAAVYMSTRQFPQQGFAMMARTTGDPASVAASVRSATRAVDAAITVSNPTSLLALLGDQLVARRVTTQVTSGFALAALALAALGMYGVLSIMVTGRCREIGVRVALGASPAAVARGVVGDSLRTSAAGLAAGVVMALVAGRLIESQLVGVSGRDPATLAGVIVILLALAALAAAAPARRAARVDPIVALRAD